eukprot:6131905-Pleurochrysis_carterae.AAC.1
MTEILRINIRDLSGYMPTLLLILGKYPASNVMSRWTLSARANFRDMSQDMIHLSKVANVWDMSQIPPAADHGKYPKHVPHLRPPMTCSISTK